MPTTTSAGVVHLLDGNVLTALVVPDHAHHTAARSWFGSGRPFATSPTVQGTLLRLLLRQGAGVTAARTALDAVTGHPRHEQWFDDMAYAEVDLSRVVGHRQVTDAYLAQVARRHRGRVATLDHGFALAADDVVDLVPV